ncbi:MAG: hypothetical protein LC624_12700 [Halobacteriales archaeon]|nr:hypothetical protein [Halobacteriales archaeon]
MASYFLACCIHAPGKAMAPRALALLALVVLLAPAVRAGSDAMLTDYALLPTEHDDQGRSDEPDRVATGVLGPLVSDCVLSFNAFTTPGLGRACVPDSALPAGILAPGCTDDAGRQPSGSCALWSQGVRSGGAQPVPAQTVGTRGMGGNRAPGAFTPTKDAALRMLDVHADLLPLDGLYTGGARTFDVDHKLADLPFDARALGLGPALIGPTAFWAWYGVWRDANGNGVIDALGDDAGQALAGNEFAWVGACDGPASAEVCLRDTGLRFPLWVWPGDHHMSCGVDIGCAPADYPGAQAVCFTVDPTPLAGSPLFRCDAADRLDEATLVGDPVLGSGTGVRPDLQMSDTTGAGELAERQWRGASASGQAAPPAFFYDQSLLSTTLTVGGPTRGSAAGDRATGFDTGLLQFVDVDRYDAVNPLLASLLPGARLPVRGAWTLARDHSGTIAETADSLLNSALLLLRAEGEHTRALEPGAYQMRGFVGAWRDEAQAMDEQTIDLAASAAAGTIVLDEDAYLLPPDGWVGNIVNTTGTYHSRGYGEADCAIGGASGPHAFAVCNPYLDGDAARVDAAQGAGQGAGIALADPQDPSSPELLAPAPPAEPYTFVLTPAGGVWAFPVLVWRDFFDQAAGAPDLEVATGLAGPITLNAMPGTDPARPASRDLLFLPEGALCAVRTQFEARVQVVAPARGALVDEAVRDVDVYAPWLGGMC